MFLAQDCTARNTQDCTARNTQAYGVLKQRRQWGWGLSRGHFTGCRNQQIGPAERTWLPRLAAGLLAKKVWSAPCLRKRLPLPKHVKPQY